MSSTDLAGGQSGVVAAKDATTGRLAPASSPRPGTVQSHAIPHHAVAFVWKLAAGTTLADQQAILREARDAATTLRRPIIVVGADITVSVLTDTEMRELGWVPA